MHNTGSQQQVSRHQRHNAQKSAPFHRHSPKSDTDKVPQPSNAQPVHSNAPPVTRAPHQSEISQTFPTPTHPFQLMPTPNMLYGHQSAPSTSPCTLQHLHGFSGFRPLTMTNRFSVLNDPRYWIPAY